MYEQSDLALIGSRIKAVRTGKGMSQADLAVKASVSLPLISNIERGKTRMQLETFAKTGLKIAFTWAKPSFFIRG